MSEQTFTLAQLKLYFHGDGVPAFIAHDGIVYDVTDCPKWRTGLHEQLHWPGQDLTTELHEAPHGDEVFTRPCVKRVGILIST